jgi:hypothetical protein
MKKVLAACFAGLVSISAQSTVLHAESELSCLAGSGELGATTARSVGTAPLSTSVVSKDQLVHVDARYSDQKMSIVAHEIANPSNSVAVEVEGKEEGSRNISFATYEISIDGTNHTGYCVAASPIEE